MSETKGEAKRRRWRGTSRAVVALLFVLVLLFVSYLRPVAVLKPTIQPVTKLSPQEEPLAWPSYGQTALGAPGYGVLATHGDVDKPVPTASVAKVLTALAVLKQYPLLKGQQGPVITVTAEDVANYQKFMAINGSVVQVQAGEQLTEYQALQALLLPSANNIADLLANWAFGSQQQYVGFANAFVKSLGLTQTTVADASGFSPKTMSTARDLVLLAENIMDNPVLAEIVGQAEATIPVAGKIQNVNILLGREDVVGIKTGNTDEAGGCFMVATRHALDKDHSIVVVVVTMGAPDLSTAIDNTLPLLRSAYANFAVTTLVQAGQTIGTYHPGWGAPVAATATQAVTGIIWKPSPPQVSTNLDTLAFRAGKPALPHGEVSATFGRTHVSSPVQGQPIPPPSLKWRLTHPFRHL